MYTTEGVFSWKRRTVASSSVWSFLGGVTTKAEAGPTSATKRETERANEVQTRRTESIAEARGWFLAARGTALRLQSEEFHRRGVGPRKETTREALWKERMDLEGGLGRWPWEREREEEEGRATEEVQSREWEAAAAAIVSVFNFFGTPAGRGFDSPVKVFFFSLICDGATSRISLDIQKEQNKK